MTRSEMVVKLTGEEADLFLKLQKVIDTQKEVGDEFDRTGEKSKRSSDEAREAARLHAAALRRAGSIINQNRTAEEKYADAVRDLKTARDAGKISVQEYERAVNRVKKRYQQVEEKQDEAFGQKAIARIGTFAASVVSARTAVDFLTSSLNDLKQARTEAIETQISLQDSQKLLAQVAPSGQLEQLEKRADSVAGSITRTESRELMFSAISEGWDEMFEYVAGLDPLVDANIAGKVAGKTTNLYKGQLSREQTFEAVLAAARGSEASFEDIGSVTTTVAQSASNIGASPSEQLATLASLTSKFTSPEQAATRINRLAAKFDIQGESFGIDDTRGLLAAVKQLQEMPTEQREKFLGKDVEVNQAFNAVLELTEDIRGRMSEIQDAIDKTGTDEQLSKVAIDQIMADPVRRKAFDLQRERVKTELANEERFAEEGADAEILRERMRQQSVNDPSQMIGQKFVRDRVADFGIDMVGIKDESFLSRAQQFIGDFVPLGFASYQSSRFNRETNRIQDRNAELREAGFDTSTAQGMREYLNYLRQANVQSYDPSQLAEATEYLREIRDEAKRQTENSKVRPLAQIGSDN